jgi:carboxypeptidase C (cathepsin A)
MNPGLHLLVHQGRYDLATPQFALQHNLDHLRIPAEARQRIHVETYDAGHMMYLHEPSARRFHDSIAAFVRATDRL